MEELSNISNKISSVHSINNSFSSLANSMINEKGSIIKEKNIKINNKNIENKEKEKEKEKEKDSFSFSRAGSFIAQRRSSIQLPSFQSINSKNAPFSASLITSDSPENITSDSKNLKKRQTDNNNSNDNPHGNLGERVVNVDVEKSGKKISFLLKMSILIKKNYCCCEFFFFFLLIFFHNVQLILSFSIFYTFSLRSFFGLSSIL